MDLKRITRLTELSTSISLAFSVVSAILDLGNVSLLVFLL